MSNSLRAATIRLAASNPELRPHLLPLLDASREASARSVTSAESLVSRSITDFDFPDTPKVKPSAERLAWRAFEDASGTMAEQIEASDLFRAWPAGVSIRVGLIPRYARGATPGWFVYALEAKTEAEAKRVGSRVQKALIAPRSLRANQVGLHTLPLTVGWSGGVVNVGAER